MEKDMDEKTSISSVVESGAYDGSQSELNDHRSSSDYMCRFCDCYFDGEETLNTHMLSHTGVKRYLCTHCQKTFAERASMVKHKKLHLDHAWSYICNICGKKFPLMFALRRHSHTHEKKSDKINLKNKAKKHKTTQSSTSSVGNPETESQHTELHREINNSQQLKEDLVRHKSKKSNLKCRFCDILVSSEEELEAHLKKHTGLRPFVCLQCGQIFTERSSMMAHKKLHLGPNAYKYECDMCGRKFAKASTLVRHKQSHTGEKPFSCSICQKSYVNQYTLKRHMTCLHFKGDTNRKLSNYASCNKDRVRVFVSSDSEQNDTNSEQMLLPCDKCGKIFTWHSALVSHKVNHHGFRPYQCEVCGKTFPRKSVLRLHLCTHSNYKTQECKLCGKRCSTTSSLNWHMKVHTGIRPFSCDVCGKSFKSKSDVYKHSKIHSSVREQFQCSVCAKSYLTKAGLESHNLLLHATEDERKVKEFKCQWCPFVCTTKNYLSKHVVTHTGQKDHMCEVCGRVFSFEYSLKRHKLMHSNVRKHQCPLCGNSFLVIFDLRRHMRLHSSEKTFRCDLCVRAFRTQKCLTKHRKKVHADAYMHMLLE